MEPVREHPTHVFRVKHMMAMDVQCNLDFAPYTLMAKGHASLRISINLEIPARWAKTSGILVKIDVFVHTVTCKLYIEISQFMKKRERLVIVYIAKHKMTLYNI